MTRDGLGGSLNLREDLIGAGRANRPGTALAARFVTVHNTSNTSPGADAAAHARFVRNTGFYLLPSGKRNHVSWHYTVDDKEVVKHLPLNERGFHAGGGNAESIGVEVCMNRGIDRAAADDRAARLVAALLLDFGLGVDAVRTHKSWTGKACPVLLLPRWTTFTARIDEVMRSVAPRAAGEGEIMVDGGERRALDSPPPPADDDDEEPMDEPDIDHDELVFAMTAEAR